MKKNSQLPKQKLELFRLAIIKYLFYELNVQSIDVFEGNPMFTMGLANNTPKKVASLDWVLEDKFIPYLRPLSDLAEMITHKGKEFVPILELAKIVSPDTDWQWHTFEKDTAMCMTSFTEHPRKYTFKSRLVFEIDTDGDFGMDLVQELTKHGKQTEDFYPVRNVLEVMEKLYEWNFDVHNLMEFGLANSYNLIPL